MHIPNPSDVEKPLSADPATRARKRKRVATITGWPACVAYRAVVPPSPPPLAYPNEKDKKRRGIITHILAKADVFVEFEASTAGKKALRPSLREEMWRRFQEEERKRRTKEKIGVAAAAVGVAGVGLMVRSGEFWDMARRLAG